MNNELLVVVFAHGKVEQTFHRHFPFWNAHKAPIHVMCPEDDPINFTGYVPWIEGKSSHAGIHSANRLRGAIDMIYGYDHVLFYEYDSICLDPASLKFKKGIQANIKQSSNPNFIAPRYVNFPWLIDCESLKLIRDAMNRWPDVHEAGYQDRLMAAWAYLAGVPMMNFEPEGWSEDRITDPDFHNLKTVIKNGGTMIHGIKTLDQLQRIVEFKAIL